MANILVLGGSGFLGSHITNKLSKDSSVCVYSPSATRFGFDKCIMTVDAYIENENELKKHISWADIIFHFVSTTNPKTSLADHQYDLKSNLLPFVGFLELMRSFPEKKIVFCSSGGAVYGKNNGNTLIESNDKNPSTSYGLVKSLMEEYIVYFNRTFGLDYLILRPSNVYGFNTNSLGNQGIISTLVHNTIFGNPSTIWVDMNNIRDYIHITDFTQAVKSLLDSSAFGIYNIGSGFGTSLRQIIDAVQNTCQREVMIQIAETLIKDEEYNVLDITKIKSLTGWCPVVGIDEGIQTVYNQMNLHFLPQKNKLN
jgi:UDP-glucose 4-epimerase